MTEAHQLLDPSQVLSGEQCIRENLADNTLVQDVITRTSKLFSALGISPSDKAIRAFIYQEANKEL